MITKKRLEEVFKNMKGEHPLGWNLYKVVVFGHNGNIYFDWQYVGQGLSMTLYNGEQDWDIDITTEVIDWQNNRITKSELIDLVKFDIDSILLEQ